MNKLKTLIDGLRERHIALAIEHGVIAGPGANGCGKGVEGYGSPASSEAVARRIKSLGGQLDYVAMDEPVWFGHIVGQLSGGRHGCQYSLAELTDRVAQKVELLRRYFPNIEIGDIEPINARSGGPQSIEDIATFESLLRQKTGVAPAFVHADVAWRFPGWEGLLRVLASRSRALGASVGVICDGDVDAGGDEAWVRQALQRCQSVAADPAIAPDTFIDQLWEPLPTRMLPETDPGSLTYEAGRLSAFAR